MEAEYTELPMALHCTISLMDLTVQVEKGLYYFKPRLITFKATVHEENQGSVILAQLEAGRHTPRSKFYAQKLHWFRLWLKLKQIKIQFI